MEATFLNRVISSDLVSGRAELEADTRHVAMVLRDLKLEKAKPVATLVAKRPKSEELPLLTAAKPLNAEDAGLYHNAIEQDVCGPSGLLVCCRPCGTRDKESHDKRLRGTQTCGTPPAGRPVGAIRFEPRCRPSWRPGNLIWNGGHVGVTLAEAWERSAKHHGFEQW